MEARIKIKLSLPPHIIWRLIVRMAEQCKYIEGKEVCDCRRCRPGGGGVLWVNGAPERIYSPVFSDKNEIMYDMGDGVGVYVFNFERRKRHAYLRFCGDRDLFLVGSEVFHVLGERLWFPPKGLLMGDIVGGEVRTREPENRIWNLPDCVKYIKS